MKNLNNSSENVKNNSKLSEIMQKKETNLPKNSSLYFQIGLILCLLATYGLFEMKFKYEIPFIPYGVLIADETIYINDPIIEPNVPKPKPVAKQVVMLTDRPPVIMPDNAPLKNLPTIETPDSGPTVDAPTPKIDEPTKTTTVETKPDELNIDNVERVPIFPGCESATNNQERKACMSEKLAKFIQRKFNPGLASDLGLNGTQKIWVQFKIDANGRVTDIKSRSPHAKLDDEAERVVGKLPIMTPGMQRETPVSVIYYFPISLQVQ